MADPVSIGIATAAAASAGSAGLGAAQSVSAGRIGQREADVAARQEEIGAVQREADRKERLADILASQNAAAGARGTGGFGGSPLTVLQADIEREQRATERDRSMAEFAARTQRARGRIARSRGVGRAATGLLRGAANFGFSAARRFR